LQEKNYILVTLFLPDSILPEEIEKEKLITGWDSPDTRPLTKKMGDNFLRSKNGLLLSVPSVLVPEENNYLINPLHSDLKKVKLLQKRRIHFDKRVAGNL